jgi:hypothetical protein
MICHYSLITLETNFWFCGMEEITEPNDYGSIISR